MDALCENGEGGFKYQRSAGSGASHLRCNPPARHASCGARVAPSAPDSATLELSAAVPSTSEETMKQSAVLILLLTCSCSEPPGKGEAPSSEQPPETAQEVSAYRACDHGAPGELVPISRRVPAEVDPATAALPLVLAGVSEQEPASGCTSFFSQSTTGALRLVSRSPTGDTIRVDFDDFSEQIPDVAGAKSFLPPGVMAELTWTIFHQFPEIQAVHFSFEGDEQAFWEWAGGPGTEAQVYTRAMWERI